MMNVPSKSKQFGLKSGLFFLFGKMFKVIGGK
jgi:hypothetical protein